MPPPLPPKVAGPLSELSTYVLVEGQVTGSLIDVLADGKHVAGGKALGASMAFPLDQGKTLKTKQVVTATATDPVSKEVSIPSPQGVTVLPKLGILPTVSVAYNQFIYGQYVVLTGMLPGAEAQIFHGNTLVGRRFALGTSVGVNLNGLTVALQAGEMLVAKQVAGAAVGPPKNGPKAEVVPVLGDKLPPPVIKAPLYACQTSFEMSGVFNGSVITLTRHRGQQTLHEAGPYGGTSNGTFLLGGPLVDGETLTIRQEYPIGKMAGIESPPYSVGLAKPTPPPFVMAPICLGATSIDLKNLVPGAHVHIIAQRKNGNATTVNLLGEGEVPKGKTDFTFNIPPIPNFPGTDLAIKAGQSLCGALSADAKPVLVTNLPKSFSAPVIPAPLYQCATVVHVQKIVPGATVVIRSTIGQGGDISALARIYKTEADIPVVSLLVNDGIYAVETGCQQTNQKQSNFQSVLALPNILPRPEVQAPITVLMQAVMVTNVLPGAQVTVYVNNIWRNAVFATGTSVSINTGSLHLNELVKAQQTLCQATSVFSDPIIPVRSGKLLLKVTPTLFQAGKATAVTAQVLDFDTKAPMGGVTIEINQKKVGVTAANGTLQFNQTFPNPGMAACRATAPGCFDAYASLQIQTPVMPGYSGVDIYNCNTDKNTVSVWVFDHSLGQMTWQRAGTQTAQYNSNGQCPYNEQGGPDSPFTVDNLKINVQYDIHVVDPNLTGCGVDDPTKQACIRQGITIKGDENGERLSWLVS